MEKADWHPTPVLLPGKSHGRRSLVGCSPWGREESGTTERLHFHFSLSCTGEGNGSPLQCSCLENSRDGGAWWAAIYGVAQSRTRLKQLSSSSYCWSVTQSCPTLCNSMDCSTSGFSVLHHVLKFAHTYVHWVNDAIQPSCLLSNSVHLMYTLNFDF